MEGERERESVCVCVYMDKIRLRGGWVDEFQCFKME